jgi:hypothetical protein
LAAPARLLQIEENRRSLHSAPPDFLSRLVALANFMRPSLGKGAHADLFSEAWQEIRVRFGRDDKFMERIKNSESCGRLASIRRFSLS